jgi:XTP/dITP diphosphohydrolase
LKILLASTNSGKLREFSFLLSDSRFTLVIPDDIQIHLDIAETGSSYLENAALKAVAFCQASGLPSLADDTGLEVDALNGAPGLHSARLIPNATDANRRRYLFQLLQDKPRPWLAHFHCTVVLALPDGKQIQGNGDCFGEIVPIERGSNGFGYDPIFQVTGTGKTMAELSTVEKNSLSHRANAFKDLLSNYQISELINQ